MADKKISAMTALSTLADGDLFEIVDVSEAAAADQNKKVLVSTLKTAFSSGGSHAVTGFAASSHNHAATDITSGTLTHERGGLEADVSAYGGLVKISGGTTSAVTAPSGAIVGTTDSQTLTNKTINTSSNTITVAASDVGSGTFDNNRIAQSNVTQHQAALSITESQISDLDHPSTKSITETAHGFAAGDVVSFNGTNWVKADANASLPAHAVCVAVGGVNTFTAAVAGFHTVTSHGFTLGQNYLSATAGSVTSTQLGPGNINQRVLVAVDTNTVIVNIGEPLT